MYLFSAFFLTEWYFNYNVILLMTMHTIGCNQRILTGDYTKVDPPLLQVLPQMLFISSWKSYDEERAIYIHSRKICARRNAYCTCSKICRMSPTYTTVIDWSRHKDTKKVIFQKIRNRRIKKKSEQHHVNKLRIKMMTTS